MLSKPVYSLYLLCALGMVLQLAGIQMYLTDSKHHWLVMNAKGRAGIRLASETDGPRTPSPLSAPSAFLNINSILPTEDSSSPGAWRYSLTTPRHTPFSLQHVREKDYLFLVLFIKILRKN